MKSLGHLQGGENLLFFFLAFQFPAYWPVTRSSPALQNRFSPLSYSMYATAPDHWQAGQASVCVVTGVGVGDGEEIGGEDAVDQEDGGGRALFFVIVVVSD